MKTMNWIKNTRLKGRLIISFCIVALFSVALCVVSVLNMKALSEAGDEMYDENVGAMKALAVMYDTMASQRICLSNHALLYETDPTFADEELVSLKEKEALFTAAMADFKSTTLNDTGATQVYDTILRGYEGEFAAAKQGVISAVSAVRASGSEEDRLAVNAAVKNMDDWGAEVSGYMDDIFDIDEKNASAKLEENDAQYINSRALVIGLAVAAFVISILFGIVIARSINDPLSRMLMVIRQAGDTGDLTFSPQVVAAVKADAGYKDEIAQMIGAFAKMMDAIIEKATVMEAIAGGDMTVKAPMVSSRDTLGNAAKLMVDSLTTIFSEVNLVAGQVATGAAQIADAAQILASASTQQAATVEELSGSVAEVAEKTQSNAAMADQAAKLSGEIRGNAQTGSGQMERMIEAVHQIYESSQAINSVISVIDNIAFQTNILALNASVEAARAGQYGKGFAVVAEEVRNLASKSAEAAKSTGALIAESVDKASLGTTIAKETAASLSKIVASVQENDRLMTEIARSSEEQSLAVISINKAIEQLSHVVQQNSATAEESAAASEEMSSQSVLLRQQIARIKLNETSGYAPSGQDLRYSPEADNFAAEETSKY
jgi:methyl-accepting chemotaxis protein